MTTEPTTAPSSRVRFAERCDFDQIMFLCRQLHEENALLDWNEDLVRRTLMTHFNGTGGLIGVIGEPNCLEGAILLRMSSEWYSDQPILEELFSFVLPEFRKSNNAKDLIDFAGSCATLIGVPRIAKVTSSACTAAKIDLYRRRIGPPIGMVFISHIQDAAHEVQP